MGNHVIVGVGGDRDNIPMFVQAFDAETGKLQWKWDVGTKMPDGRSVTGGTTWMPGTYDPELNHLLYWGTGNPTAGAGRISAARRQPVHLQPGGIER